MNAATTPQKEPLGCSERMKTTYNPTRGIDLYLDASGEDDWLVGTTRYYLVGFMACGASGEWIQWMEKHRTEYDGMIHWSAHQFGKQKRKLLHPEEHCKGLLAMHPCQTKQTIT